MSLSASLRRPPAAGTQVTKYVEREILNHRQLVHPHIIQFKEVRGRGGAGGAGGGGDGSGGGRGRSWLRQRQQRQQR